mgnify:CR=1 FL=1
MVENKNFEKKVKNFVIRSLGPFIKYKKLMKRATSGKNLETFKEAFIHESIDKEKNYKELETLGDAMIGAIFFSYLTHTLKEKISQEILTLLKTNYLARTRLAKWSTKYGLLKTAIYKGDLEFKEVSDFFESFVGATTVVFDNLVAKGYGYSVAYQWFVALLEQEAKEGDKIEIDANKAYFRYKDSVSKLKDYYDFNAWGNVEYKYISLDGKFKATILRGGKVIGTGESKKEQQDAKEKAATNALKNLGVDEELLLRYKNSPLYDKTNPKSKDIKFFMFKNKITDLFIHSKKSKGQYIIELRGNQKGKEKVFGSGKGFTIESATQRAIYDMIKK